MSFAITYETLFDLLRKETSREDLQELPETFYGEVLDFMRKKQEDAAASGIAGQRATIEFENIKKIMKELYDRRERKILLLALNKARTESAIIDPSILLPQERTLFDKLVTSLRNNKKEVLDALFALEAVPKGIARPLSARDTPSAQAEESQLPEKETPKAGSTDKSMLKVKFLNSLPKFLGPDKTVFGPYEKGAEAQLPAGIATVLIKKGRVEKM